MSKFKFDRVLQNITAMKATLPKVLANDAQRFFGQSFEKQGFENVGVTKWAERKNKSPKNEGRNILVQSGRLRRAVMQSAKLITFERITFIVDVPYAAIHNEGGKMKNGTMPQRQFMGNSRALINLLQKKINLAVEKIWRA